MDSIGPKQRTRRGKPCTSRALLLPTKKRWTVDPAFLYGIAVAFACNTPVKSNAGPNVETLPRPQDPAKTQQKLPAAKHKFAGFLVPENQTKGKTFLAKKFLKKEKRKKARKNIFLERAPQLQKAKDAPVGANHPAIFRTWTIRVTRGTSDWVEKRKRGLSPRTTSCALIGFFRILRMGLSEPNFTLPLRSGKKLTARRGRTLVMGRRIE